MWVLAALLGACRGRAVSVPAVDWKPAPHGTAEVAALLLLDSSGTAQIVCLPERRPLPIPLSEVPLRRILDAGWRQGSVIAASTEHPAPDSGEDLLLLVPETAPRPLAPDVRRARLSPDATALAYETGQPNARGPRTHVLEIATDQVSVLDGMTDALWEADGEHLRATEVHDDDPAEPSHSKSLRVRWDRKSGATTPEGPGSAQLPAPIGSAVAWTEQQRGAPAPDRCAVFLTPRGGVKHAVVGRFCAGIADDRGLRWSPDGRWLAFAHPEPGAQPQGRAFVDVVSADGGRYPSLPKLAATVAPDRQPSAQGTAMWFDWSPSGRLLAFNDGTGDVRVYDFETRASASLGKARSPTWSPGGQYLLVASPPEATEPEAFVVSGTDASEKTSLGAIRDARWLPAQACMSP